MPVEPCIDARPAGIEAGDHVGDPGGGDAVVGERNPDGTEGEVFEVFQKLTDPTLTHHPETGEPVRKLIVTPQVQTSSDTQRFSKNNLERLGFSRFERKGDGHYEKTAGTGPDTLNAGD